MKPIEILTILVEFVRENWLPISGGLYELIVRLIPTSKNWSILDKVFLVLNTIVPNNKKEPPIKSIILFLLLSSLVANAQLNGNFNSVRLVPPTDTSRISHINGTLINFNNQYFLGYNNNVWAQLGGGASRYLGNSPTTVTVGGLSAGTVIYNQTYDYILGAMLAPYINPVFTSFYNNVPNAVEVGTTISGSKNFNWSITPNSGVVPTITIQDGTAAIPLATSVSNTGSYSTSITTLTFTSPFQTQTWYGIGNNTSPSGTFNSSPYITTAYYYYFYGASTPPTNSATVRALPSNAFYTAPQTFILNTGSTLTTFNVCLPTGKSIVQVIDLDALNANITSSYVAQSPINVTLPNGATPSYPFYLMTLGTPYSASHRHQITTN
jgi:hypothetical protein